MPEQPPSLPGTLSRPDAQRIIDALNLRLFEVEEGKGINAGKVTDEKLATPVIAGAVKASGEKEAGEDFVSSRTATGTYKIELTAELGTNGILVATQVGGASPAVMIGGGPSKKVFVLETYKAAAALETINTAFTFHIKAI